MTRENVFVVGFPRSGNTWVARLLGDALDSPIKKREGKGESIADEGFGRPGNYIIRQEHSDPDQIEKNEHVILVIRDPKDVAVSAMHYWELKDIEKAANCIVYGRWPTPHGSGWVYFYDWWLEEGFDYLIRYEKLHKSTKQELENMLGAINAEPENDLNKVVARQSFGSRKKYAKIHGHKMPHGYTVQNKALRKGTVGDWKNYFDADLLRKMNDAEPYNISYKELVKELGYYVRND